MPQADVGVAMQVPVGSVPPGRTLWHTPSKPGTPQLVHESTQDELPQQKPSVQKRPDWHWSFAVQAVPLPLRGWQVPPMPVQ